MERYFTVFCKRLFLDEQSIKKTVFFLNTLFLGQNRERYCIVSSSRIKIYITVLCVFYTVKLHVRS